MTKQPSIIEELEKAGVLKVEKIKIISTLLLSRLMALNFTWTSIRLSG